MGSFRAHPIALVTMACLACVVVAALQTAGPDWLIHAAATAVLVSPLAIVLWAHVWRATNWKHDLWLALCALVVAGLSVFAVFLLAWFKPGWLGVWVFAVLLSALSLACVLLVPRERKARNAA